MFCGFEKEEGQPHKRIRISFCRTTDDTYHLFSPKDSILANFKLRMLAAAAIIRSNE
jgi:hypothetical protein